MGRVEDERYAVSTMPNPVTNAHFEEPDARHQVLVVDDNEDAATSLSLLLTVLGAEVQVAHDGPAALELMQTCRPDIVMLDLGIPGMNGFEIARRARELPELARTTLVALTGWTQDDYGDRARSAGFDHYLVKPADVARLQALLDHCRSTTSQ